MSLQLGLMLKQEGIERVTNSHLPWIEQAMSLLPALLRGKAEVTGEEMRLGLLNLGLPVPGSPNAWGALTMLAVKRRLLGDSGRVRAMTESKSHARRTPIWIVRI